MLLLMQRKTCCTCGVEGPKYKCRCLATYCSVECFKKHKEVCAGPTHLARATVEEPGISRDTKNRVRLYEIDREEASFTVTDTKLHQLLQLECVQNVMSVLKKRKTTSVVDGEKEVVDTKVDEDEDDDGPPVVLSSAERKRPVDEVVVRQEGLSALTAEQKSLAEWIARNVEEVCRAPTMRSKRSRLEQRMERDNDLAEFCDKLLKEIGARDNEGRFILE